MSGRSHLLNVLRESLRNPGLIFRMLTRRNFRILLKAIRNENPATIVSNFHQALIRLRPAILAEKQSGRKVVWQVERADLVDHRYLFVAGWAISPVKITGCAFVTSDEREVDLLLGPVRDEIRDIYRNWQSWDMLSFRRMIDLGHDPEYIGKRGKIRVRLESGMEEIAVAFQAAANHENLDLDDQYQKFLLRNHTQTINRKDGRQLRDFAFQPLISLITPVYNVEPKWLNLCIESVLAQVYDNWELCLYDDHSTHQATLDCLAKWQEKDPRIKIKLGARNQNISIASNEAIKMATGEFVGILDHDDELTSDALYEMIGVLNEHPDADLIYSDEDKLELDGTFTRPHFKPDFNLDLLRSNNYICHFTVIRKSVGDRVGWFSPGLEGSQDHDLILKVVDTSSEDKIIHIPKVLYHWRRIPGSTAESYHSKHYAFEAGRLAVERHLERNHLPAQVVKSEYAGAYRVIWDLDPSRSVTIIIPFRDKISLLQRCVDSILQKTAYANYEILLISNNSREEGTFRYLEEICRQNRKVRMLEWNHAFNYSAINNFAVQSIDMDYVLFLNNDTEVINEDWLTEMMRHIQRPDVGAVGAKLYFPDGSLQHAGVVLGLGGAAGNILSGSDGTTMGYQYRAVVSHNLSACTGACLLVKRALFQDIGGFDAVHLGISYNDVDLCLRIREKGFLIVYTPEARLYHYESATRTSDHMDEQFWRERDYFRTRWKHFLNDPFYNPNLTLDKADFSLRIS
jgi:O-antigen biosynthesis protein